jgi:hypothetical protein
MLGGQLALVLLVLTVPLAAVKFRRLKATFRVWHTGGLSRIVFVLCTALGWFGLGGRSSKALNAGRIEYALLTVGLIAGAVLAWRPSGCGATRPSAAVNGLMEARKSESAECPAQTLIRNRVSSGRAGVSRLPLPSHSPVDRSQLRSLQPPGAEGAPDGAHLYRKRRP